MTTHHRNPIPQPKSAPPSGPNPNHNPNPNLPSPASSASPSPDLVPLSSLLDPRFTLDQLADQFHTTIEAISRWMLQPDIQERIEIIETASIQRARIAAHRALPAIATACHSIITTFNNHQPPAQLDPNDHAALEQERRKAETARRAGVLLLRISRFRRITDTSVSGAASASPAGNPTPSTGASRAREKRNAAIVLDLINTPEFASALAAAMASPAPAAPAEKVTEQSGVEVEVGVGVGVGVGEGTSAAPLPNPPSEIQNPKSAPAPTQHSAPDTQHSPSPRSEVQSPRSPSRSRDPTARAA